MKQFWIIALIGLIVSFSGCGKKAHTEPVVVSESAVPAELPVLDQNKVPANPFVGSGPKDIAFEPAPDEIVHDEAADKEPLGD